MVNLIFKPHFPFLSHLTNPIDKESRRGGCVIEINNYFIHFLQKVYLVFFLIILRRYLLLEEIFYVINCIKRHGSAKEKDSCLRTCICPSQGDLRIAVRISWCYVHVLLISPKSDSLSSQPDKTMS